MQKKMSVYTLAGKGVAPEGKTMNLQVNVKAVKSKDVFVAVTIYFVKKGYHHIKFNTCELSDEQIKVFYI